MEIRSSSDLRANITIKSLSIGDSGKGKTYFAGTIADYGKPFIISSEGGLLTSCDKEFDYVEVNTFKQFEEACGLFMQIYKEKGYTHLVVDSITRLQYYLTRDLAPDGKLTQNQWGEVLAKLRKVVDWLTKEVPIHVHVTAMAKESKDELTGMVKIYPNLQGAFQYDLAGYFDIVLYHDCKYKGDEQQYYVWTKGDQRVVAKSRLDKIKPLNKYEHNNYSIIAGIYKGDK